MQDGIDSLYIVGGADRAGLHMNDVWRFDTVAGKLFSLHAGGASDGEAPAPAGGHACLGLRARASTATRTAAAEPTEHDAAVPRSLTHILAYGGINFAEGHVYGDMHAFDLARQRWCTIACRGAKPPARTGHSLTEIPLTLKLDDVDTTADAELGVLVCQAVLFGGSSPSDGPMNDLHVMRLLARWGDAPADGEAAPLTLTCTWTELGTRGPAPAARELHAAFVRSAACVAPHFVVFSGRNEDGQSLRDMCALDLATLTWQSPVRGLDAAVAAAYAADGDVLYCFGGLTAGSTLSGDVLVLDARTGSKPSEWTWRRQAIKGKPQPAPRFAAGGAMMQHVATRGLAFMPDAAGEVHHVLYAFGGMTAEADLNELVVVAL